jgi:hypothetical protein
MCYDFLPFNESLIPAACELLAERHSQDRVVLPALPQCFLSPHS